jgi:capsular polysaccharide biosynthesis protein
MTPTDSNTLLNITIAILAFTLLIAYLYPLLRKVYRLYRIRKLQKQTPSPLLGVVYPDKDVH